MSRITIEYNPPLTLIAQSIIRKEVTPSMTSNDNLSYQYDIDMVAECLQEVITQKLEEVEVVDDLALINKYRDENVNYIEF